MQQCSMNVNLQITQLVLCTNIDEHTRYMYTTQIQPTKET